MPNILAVSTLAPVTPSKEIHGGKGYGLLEMSRSGFDVPEALVITTEAWHSYRKKGVVPPSVRSSISAFLKQFPDALFSVRSGAPVSMPGMMDTVLNVGATPETDAALPGAYRRFSTAWLEIVHGVERDKVREIMARVNSRAGDDRIRGARLVQYILERAGYPVPSSRVDQVMACVEAVFRSWDTPRAVVYRKVHGIPETMGTACVVQRMVMGTAPGLSGSGVMFSRDPATGENRIVGEIALNAQGEEVVNGSVTPLNIDKLRDHPEADMRDLHTRLVKLAVALEKHFGDVQDIEFTVESGKLYVLQARTAKMAATARVVTGCALAEGIADPGARLSFLTDRISPATVAAMAVPKVEGAGTPAAEGIAASPGAVCGRVVFRWSKASMLSKGCILVADDTAPEDFPIMAAVGGIFTSAGGFTCHSAVVARGTGIPAVVGCGALEVSPASKGAMVAGVPLKEGDFITIDGSSGAVWHGQYPVVVRSQLEPLYKTIYGIVKEGIPGHEKIWWHDNGVTARQVLPLPPYDPGECEKQLSRAQALMDKGHEVAFRFQLVAPDEDLLPPKPGATFSGLADILGPDLAGMRFVPDLPASFVQEAMDCLGMVPLPAEIDSGGVIVGDLLSALTPDTGEGVGFNPPKGV